MNYGDKIMIYTLKVEDKSVDNKDQSIKCHCYMHFIYLKLYPTSKLKIISVRDKTTREQQTSVC